ncbi:hypothetical protein [Atopobium fossor]|uniref:hypothetical protein n=1 Tax=Atopobium fossor TaxID=39487 RepID=UPI0004058964|nr:hypothetical protein [Atopobium fossor]
MRKNIPWKEITESSDDFTRLPAGPYVAKIIDVKDNESKEYLEIVFDIAEGGYAGFYSDDWGKTHPYAHHFFMSYKDSAFGMLKGRLNAINDSNPGFDGFAAFDAGREDMFVNRLVGLNLQEEEYEYEGKVRTRLNVCQVVAADKVRNGEIKAREPKKLERDAPVSTYDDLSDIPFR